MCSEGLGVDLLSYKIEGNTVPIRSRRCPAVSLAFFGEYLKPRPTAHGRESPRHLLSRENHVMNDLIRETGFVADLPALSATDPKRADALCDFFALYEIADRMGLRNIFFSPSGSVANGVR